MESINQSPDRRAETVRLATVLRQLAQRIEAGEADDTMDLGGSDYGWYKYGQGHVAEWLERLAEESLKGEQSDGEACPRLGDHCCPEHAEEWDQAGEHIDGHVCTPILLPGGTVCRCGRDILPEHSDGSISE